MTSSRNRRTPGATPSGRRRCFRAAVLCLLASFWTSHPARASIVSPEEQKCYNDSRSTTPRAVVRREARAVLAQQPASFMAEYVLGLLEVSDGNYPDGLRHLQRARHLAGAYAPRVPEDAAELAGWKARITLAAADALDNADRLPEAVQAWDDASGLYRDIGGMPDRLVRRTTALLKLGRTDEARHLADLRAQEVGLSDPEQLALRVAMARIDFALEPDGARAYEAFRAMLQDNPASSGLALPYGDIAYHAKRQGNYEQARTALARSAAIVNPASAAHPYRALAEMDIAAANWTGSRANIRNAWNWLQSKEANVRYELLADTRLVAAQFYLAIGYPERAEKLALPYVFHPIRSGFSTRPLEQWEAGINLLCWSASRQIRVLEAAAVSGQPWYKRVWVAVRHMPRRWREGIQARRIRSLLVSQVRRQMPMRDVLALVDAPHWLWGDMAAVLGPRQFDRLVSAYPLQGAQQKHFLSALRAQSALSGENWKQATEWAEQALADLPSGEVLLRARMTTVMAEAMHRLGREKDSAHWFAKAQAADRAVALNLLVRLPLFEVPTELAHSPLIRTSPSGPRMTLERTADRLSFHIAWNGGDEPPPLDFSTALMPSAPDASSLLHRLLFSPLGLLDETDYAPLEGQAVSGPSERPDRMDRMLRNASR